MSTPPATRSRPGEIAALLGVAGVIVVADQLTKAAVAAALPLGGSRNVIGEVVQIWHAENSGAAFSLLQNGLPLFLVVTVVALGLVAYYARSLHGRSWWYFLALGLLLGGTLGNLVDRVTRGGRVIDFVSVGFGDTRFPTFNVADSALTVGVILLIAILWLFDDTERMEASRDRGAGSGVALPSPPSPPGGEDPRGGGAG